MDAVRFRSFMNQPDANPAHKLHSPFVVLSRDSRIINGITSIYHNYGFDSLHPPWKSYTNLYLYTIILHRVWILGPLFICVSLGHRLAPIKHDKYYKLKATTKETPAPTKGIPLNVQPDSAHMCLQSEERRQLARHND